MEVRFNDVTVDYLGDIQSLRSQLGGDEGVVLRGGQQNVNVCKRGGGVTSM